MRKERIQLSDHFGFSRLIRFTLPTIGMMIIVSVYACIDGFFVANYVGTTPFAAVNLTYPILCVFVAVSYMMGSGGSALVAKTLGEGDRDKANQLFTMIASSAFVINVILAVIGYIFTPQLVGLLGAEGELLEQCVIYGRICFVGQPFYAMQVVFLTFFVTAEKPRMSLVVNLLAGVANFVLDALFIVVFHWGIAGAAAATALGQLVGSVIPAIYFMRPNHSLLSLRFPIVFDSKALQKTFGNGASEMVTNLSAAVMGILFNYQFMRLAGETGIAAFGAVDYTMFFFLSVFFGYSDGLLPVIGYHFGAENKNELKSLFKKSLILMFGAGLTMSLLSHFLARPLAMLFLNNDPVTLDMAVHGFHLYVFAFTFLGLNVFGSAFFTGLNDGKVSAFLSFMRTLVLEVIAVILLPIFLGIDGLWLSYPVGEGLSLLITLTCFLKYRRKYGYL